MPNAVIVAHGQPSDPAPAEAALAEFASGVDVLTPGATVRSATLAAPDALESRLDSLGDDTVIYPLFMAKGWFVTSALPKRVGQRAIRILDPLGIDPKLPQLVSGALGATLDELDWNALETDLVIAAHGSGRSRNPSEIATEFASQLERLLSFKSVRLGFVEESPSIAEAATGTGDQALCLPFFACTGGHALMDVPDQLKQAQFKGTLIQVVGELPMIQKHIADVLQQAFSTR